MNERTMLNKSATIVEHVMDLIYHQYLYMKYESTSMSIATCCCKNININHLKQHQESTRLSFSLYHKKFDNIRIIWFTMIPHSTINYYVSTTVQLDTHTTITIMSKHQVLLYKRYNRRIWSTEL